MDSALRLLFTRRRFLTSWQARRDILKMIRRIRDCDSTHPSVIKQVLIRAFELYTIVKGDVSYREDLTYILGLTNQPDNNPKYLHFFLQGANDAKLTLNGGIRLQDYLLVILRRHSYRRLNWENLYTLIKFGTKDLEQSFCYKPDKSGTLTYQQYKGLRVPPYPLLDLLNFLMKEVYRYSRIFFDPEVHKYEHKRCGIVLQCMKMVFRAIGTFPKYHLPKCNGPFFTDYTFLDNKMARAYDTMLNLQEELGHFPELEERANVMVAPLTHICRMSVRKRLYDNWRLPGGIYDLPIPGRMKEYIDLRTSTI